MAIERRKNVMYIVIFMLIIITGINAQNNFAPVFDYFPTPISIPENIDFGTVIWTCNATDGDPASTPAGKIRYKFSAAISKYVLDPRTCEMYINHQVDYDTQTFYNLSIFAYDLDTNSKSADQRVIINVIDDNDNSPTCEKYFRVVSVSEDVSINTPLGKLECEDADSDKSTNGRVNFKLSDSNTAEVKTDFRVTGVDLYTDRLLDYETHTDYVVKIDVYDSGTPSRTATVVFNVEVDDVDDNKPTWPVNPIIKTVVESSPLDAVVFTLAAVDADKPNTDASSIRYEITKPGVPDWFDIDRKSGAVSVKGILNYNIAPWVTIEVKAYSSDKVNDFNPVVVNISLTDENTIAPLFEQISYITNIKENTAIGTSVITLTASDPESGVNGEIEYSLTSSQFAVDPVTGLVTTIANVDFEAQNVYSLQVQAQDKGTPPQSGFTFLIINILSVNEFDPVISGPTAPIDIYEDAEPGSIIFNITAMDNDAGLDGIVVFSLGNSLDPFTIEPSTGILRVGSNLDREDQSLWEIIVIATDQSETNPRSSSMTITVNILDVNDNTPICEPLPNIVVRLPHNIGEVLAPIYCVDDDDGLNSELVYTKISGDPSDSFDVDASHGNITLKAPPNQTQYFINIQIKDKGNPERSVTLVFNVIAELVYSIKNLPESVTVSENTNVAVEIFDVDACCVFSLTHYSILDGNNDNHIIIDPSSGKIILMDSFDREVKDTFQYVIRARAVETNTTTDSYLDVTIEDANDNAPKFESKFHFASVSEDLAPLTKITQVTATDADIGSNQDLTYAIVAGNDDGKFEIDALGNINLLLTLDAETQTLYSLTITATDSGIIKLTGTTNIDIEVKNVDDFSPELVNVVDGSVVTDVSEDLALGAPVFSLLATDGDIDTVFTYTIENGNVDSSFVIDSTSGSIFLAKLLDRETIDQYNLTVDATTQDGQSVSAVITINVLDVNDNDPKFEKDVYNLYVTHDDPADKLVETFIITDKDAGVNKDVSSLTIIDGDPGNHFKIVGNQIFTNVIIDFYARKLYTLSVKVTDGGIVARSGFARVIITVIPIYKPPLIPVTDYTKTLKEDVNPTDDVIDMDATADGGVEGDSGTLQYNIRSGNEAKLFYITDFLGQVKVASNLDFEVSEQFILVIDATSREDPTLSSSATVTIDVENVNDNAPKFNKAVYSFNIDEDAGTGDPVGTVTATDLDKPPFNTINYSLTSTTGSTDFTISNTGVITLNQQLDFRRQNIYNLPVIANDGGVVQGESLVVIRVNDINDHTPTFTPGTVNIEVVESVGIGLTVFTAKAIDLDTGLLGELQYTLVSGNTGNQLALDIDTGALTVASALDRELHDRFDLIIRAEDKDTPALSGTLSLTVHVADVNDKDPSFPNGVEMTTINRDSIPGTPVFTVTATDEDIGDNGVVVYEITSGNTDGLFIIGLNTGEIKTASSVTLAENEYNLQITAKDKGIPVRSGVVTVNVAITPSKVFGLSEQSMVTIENFGVDTPLNQVTPKAGHDAGATIQYVISRGNFGNSFKIDQTTGLISTAKVIDREQYPSYILSIDISDNNGVSYTKTVSITVLDVNDNDPVITTTDTNIYVVENTPAGQIVAGFTVTDADAGNNSIVYLEISPTPVDASEFFYVSGNFLKVTKPLDYETKSSFTVNVLAKDRGDPQRSGSIQLTVTVVDIPDQTTYIDGKRELPSIYISRETSYNSPNGATVTALTPQDFGKTAQTEFTSLNREGIFAVAIDGTVTVQKADLLEAEKAYYIWVVATTKTPTNTTSVLGLLRIDTFDPNSHVVSLESPLDVTELEAIRPDIIKAVKNFFPIEDEPNIWKIQSYQINARRKLLAAGSQVLIYVLKGPVSDDISDFEKDRTFLLIKDMLNKLREDPSKDSPQPSLNTATFPVVAVNGYSEPVLPKTEKSSASEDFVTSLEGYITFGLIALIFLVVVIILVICYFKKKKKNKRSTSAENLVYTDPLTNSKKVALVVPKGLGKKENIPTNKTTRRISLGPASTSLPPTKPRKKSSTTGPPPAASSGMSTELTPVQSDEAKPVTPVVTPTIVADPKVAKRPLVTSRKISDTKTPEPEKPKETTNSNPAEVTTNKKGAVVHRGKEYDGIGHENGKTYAYNTRTGSTLWVENSLDKKLGPKKKAAPKLTVVGEASTAASPNLSLNRK